MKELVERIQFIYLFILLQWNYMCTGAHFVQI